MGAVSSGIEELDKILDGGFLEGQVIVVAGNPGSGKTTFGAQFLYDGLRKGEPGIFVSFVEPKEDFMKYMGLIGFDFAGYEEEGKFLFIEALTMKDADALNALIENVSRESLRLGAKRLVLDSISALKTAFSKRDIRAYLHNALLKVLKALRLTALLIVDMPYGARIIGYGVEEFIFDGVITLEVELQRGLPKRRLVIRKLRGKPLPTSHYDVILGHGGLKLIPPLTSVLKGTLRDETAKFGISELDGMLGGGLRRGSATILVGPSGSGKTLLALTFALEGARNGERCLYLSHEESADQLRKCLSLMGAAENEIKNIVFVSAGAVAQTPYEAYDKSRRLIEAIKPDRFIIDGLTALRRVYSERDFHEVLRSLLSICKEKEITTLMTFIGVPFEEELGVSTIADNLIAIMLERAEDRITRRIGVIKSRGSKTSETLKTITFAEGGKIIVRE